MTIKTSNFVLVEFVVQVTTTPAWFAIRLPEQYPLFVETRAANATQATLSNALALTKRARAERQPRRSVGC